MKVINDLLNALTNVEKSIGDPINDAQTRKNEILEIKNILFNYNNEITEKNILEFKDEDIKRILELYSHDNNELYKQYKIYKNIVVSYEEINNKYKNIDAPQVESAKKWFKKLAFDITKYMQNVTDTTDEYIKTLKEKNVLPRKYLNMFKNEKLIEPILSISEFNELINEMFFDLKKRIKIKSEIAKMNAEIMFLDDQEESAAALELEKYKNLVENVKSKHQKVYDELNEENLTADEVKDKTDELSKKYKLDEKTLQDVIKAVLLNKELNNENVSLEKLEEIYNLKLELTKEENKKSDLEDASIISEVNQILEKEKRLINKTNEKEFDIYLAQSIDSNDEKAISYKIVSVLTALYSECEKLKNSKGLKLTHDNAVGNIRQYIDAYNVLHETLEKVLNEKMKKVLYLTNKKEYPYILEDAKKYNETEKNSLYDLLYNLLYEDISKVKCSEILSDLEIYRISNDVIKMAFIKLDNDYLLVLNASIINGDDKTSSFVFSQDVKVIKDVIKMSNDKDKIEKLYKKQAKFRKELWETLN